MYLQSLTLEEFRSYHHQSIELPERGLGLFGANASGKSTLLEAIAMLATTRSPRTTTERELINWRSGDDLGVPPFARISGHIARADRDVELEMALQADPNRPGSAKKQIRVNGRPVRAMDAVGLLNAVLFSPEDVGLITGPPAARRRYLDLTISQLDGRYLRALARYNKILEQRNSLLKSLLRDGVPAESPLAASQLAFWDEELVDVGSRVLSRRIDAIRQLSPLVRTRFSWLTEGGTIDLTYACSVGEDLVVNADRASSLSDLELRVARTYSAILHERRVEEVRRGMSLFGPHRDDFAMSIDGVDLASFGSRGQQRLAVVALKLAEADLMVAETEERPVLLLDDVLSELDERHRRMLTSAITEIGSQVIMTTTDESTFELPKLRTLPRAEVEAGRIGDFSPDLNSSVQS
ncbi:MAG TPA: DNA replication/repair protein RecF [Thermomicrobiales bacterium]|nr:DNA replication/repair protein RecF [Thermomicrobiales bacterium]